MDRHRLDTGKAGKSVSTAASNDLLGLMQLLDRSYTISQLYLHLASQVSFNVVYTAIVSY